MAAERHLWLLGCYKSISPVTGSNESHLQGTSFACAPFVSGALKCTFHQQNIKGDTRRGHFAWQHILKAKERWLFFVVIIIVSGVPLTKKCSVFQMPLSTNASHHPSSVSCHFEMAEVAFAHDAVIFTMLDTGDDILREIDMVVFFSSVCIVIAATPRCHFNKLSP